MFQVKKNTEFVDFLYDFLEEYVVLQYVSGAITPGSTFKSALDRTSSIFPQESWKA